MAQQGFDFEIQSLNAPVWKSMSERTRSLRRTVDTEQRTSRRSLASLASYYTYADGATGQARDSVDAGELTTSSAADEREGLAQHSSSTILNTKVPSVVVVGSSPIEQATAPKTSRNTSPHSSLEAPMSKQDRAALEADAWWLRKVESGALLPWEQDERNAAAHEQAKTVAETATKGHRPRSTVISMSNLLNVFNISHLTQSAAVRLQQLTGRASQLPEQRPNGSGLMASHSDDRTLAKTKQQLLQIQRDREARQQLHRSSKFEWVPGVKQMRASHQPGVQNVAGLEEVTEMNAPGNRTSFTPLIRGESENPLAQMQAQQLEQYKRQKKRDTLVVMFAIGFLCPIAWLIAGFLMNKPDEDSEEQLPLGIQHYEVGVWRIANRIMAGASILILFLVLSVALIIEA